MSFKQSFSIGVFLFGAALANAQSPIPMTIVQAAPAVPAQGQLPGPTAAASVDSTQVILRALQQVKAANDEVLKKQTATLQQLEEMEKAADQIKIYTKRG